MIGPSAIQIGDAAFDARSRKRFKASRKGITKNIPFAFVRDKDFDEANKAIKRIHKNYGAYDYGAYD